jgi:hypothetical protein
MRRTSSGRTVALLVVLGLVLAIAPTLAAGFTVCGVSGCSGGGFGRSTDPGTTRLLLVVAGVAAALPLAVLAVVRRRAALALAAVGLAVAGTLVAGLVVGADFRGCPRGVSVETCREQARP